MTDRAAAGIQVDRCQLGEVALSKAIPGLTDTLASGGGVYFLHLSSPSYPAVGWMSSLSFLGDYSEPGTG